MVSKKDVLAAKTEIASRLLRTGLRGGVIGFRQVRDVSKLILRAAHNVHAVGIGYKLVNGKSSKTLCVRIYVANKLPKSLIPPRFLVSQRIAGIPTDVIQAAPAFLLAKSTRGSQPARRAVRGTRKHNVDAMLNAAGRESPEPQRLRHRPVMPGVSVGHFAVTAGTIACFCRKHGEGIEQGVFVLSNNHVLADSDRGFTGDNLLQPGRVDADEFSGTDHDHFADLERAVPLRFGGTDENPMDAAIGRLKPGIDFEPAIPQIGRIAGWERATDGMQVLKFGRTTGLTTGVVDDVHCDALVGMSPCEPHLVAKFCGQLRIVPTTPGAVIGLDGDSGSLVVRQDNHFAVGLYFAGPESGVYGFANHIDDVLDELRLDII